MSEPRPFRVLGVQQIALGSADKSRLAKLWVDLLGLERSGSHRLPSENVDEDILRAGVGPLAVEIDPMQPVDPNGRPRIAEPALTTSASGWTIFELAVEWLTARGVRFAPGGIRRGAAGHDVCFIHPKGTDGAAGRRRCAHRARPSSSRAPRAHAALSETPQFRRSFLPRRDAGTRLVRMVDLEHGSRGARSPRAARTLSRVPGVGAGSSPVRHPLGRRRFAW